jgi:hypothetical protein
VKSRCIVIYLGIKAHEFNQVLINQLFIRNARLLDFEGDAQLIFDAGKKDAEPDQSLARRDLSGVERLDNRAFGTNALQNYLGFRAGLFLCFLVPESLFIQALQIPEIATGLAEQIWPRPGEAGHQSTNSHRTGNPKGELHSANLCILKKRVGRPSERDSAVYLTNLHLDAAKRGKFDAREKLINF